MGRSMLRLATLLALMRVLTVTTPSYAAELPGPHTLEDPAIQAQWSPAAHRAYNRARADAAAPHDWKLIARGTNVVLQYDADSLRRRGDDVEVLQTSQALNPRGWDFLEGHLEYRGVTRVQAMINDIEFDCVAPREQLRVQWLEDPAGNMLRVMDGPGRWLPLTSDFAAMRGRFCNLEGLPGTTPASEVTAFSKAASGLDTPPAAQPRTPVGPQGLGPDSMFGLELPFFLIALVAGVYHLAAVALGFDKVLNPRTMTWTDLNTRRARIEALLVGLMLLLSAVLIPEHFDRGRFFTDLGTVCSLTLADLLHKLQAVLG